jgi:hypothetical protein
MHLTGTHGQIQPVDGAHAAERQHQVLERDVLPRPRLRQQLRQRFRPRHDCSIGFQWFAAETGPVSSIWRFVPLQEVAMSDGGKPMRRVLIGLIIAVSMVIVAGLLFLNVEVRPNPVASSNVERINPVN